MKEENYEWKAGCVWRTGINTNENNLANLMNTVYILRI